MRSYYLSEVLLNTRQAVGLSREQVARTGAERVSERVDWGGREGGVCCGGRRMGMWVVVSQLRSYPRCRLRRRLAALPLLRPEYIPKRRISRQFSQSSSSICHLHPVPFGLGKYSLICLRYVNQWGLTCWMCMLILACTECMAGCSLHNPADVALVCGGGALCLEGCGWGVAGILGLGAGQQVFDGDDLNFRELVVWEGFGGVEACL